MKKVVLIESPVNEVPMLAGIVPDRAAGTAAGIIAGAVVAGTVIAVENKEVEKVVAVNKKEI